MTCRMTWIPFFIKNIYFSSLLPFADHDLDEIDMQTVRYKPEGLDKLCKMTKFSKKELQLMYRGFKQVRNVKKFVSSLWKNGENKEEQQ